MHSGSRKTRRDALFVVSAAAGSPRSAAHGSVQTYSAASSHMVCTRSNGLHMELFPHTSHFLLQYMRVNRLDGDFGIAQLEALLIFAVAITTRG